MRLPLSPFGLFVKRKMLKLGIEPKTFALLARRSNQLSYSSTNEST